MNLSKIAAPGGGYKTSDSTAVLIRCNNNFANLSKILSLPGPLLRTACAFHIRRSFSEGGWRRPGSNRQPPACKAGALPVELRPRSRLRGKLEARDSKRKTNPKSRRSFKANPNARISIFRLRASSDHRPEVMACQGEARRHGSDRGMPGFVPKDCAAAIFTRQFAERRLGPGRFELPTSPLSGARSSQLSYEPFASAAYVTNNSLWPQLAQVPVVTFDFQKSNKKTAA
jgi:hypothetical protein